MDGDVSSTTAAGEGRPLADPELPPQPNASSWPAMGPTENDAAFLRHLAFTRPYRRGLVLSRLPLGGPNTGRSVIFFETTRDDGGGGDPRHGGGVDADADADAAGADDDDEEEEFGFGFGAVPASGVAIACLPERTVVDDDGEGREREEYCAVCLEEYEAGDAVRTMPCAHGFHERCIFWWLRASRLCPLCRFALPAESEEDEDTAATDVEVGRDDDDQGDADDDDGPLDTFERMFVT